MNVAPGADYEAVLETGLTGLEGTIAVALSDNEGNLLDPLDTAGITETPAGTGIYVAARTAPIDAGQFTIIWSLDGTLSPDVTTEELVVTYSAPVDPPAGDTYVSVDELFRVLRLRTPTPAQRDAGYRVLVAAAGEINSEIGTTSVGLAGWELHLAAEVNLERAVEHWQQEESPFGIVGVGDGAAILSARDSWDRHAHKLAPLKRTWGIA